MARTQTEILQELGTVKEQIHAFVMRKISLQEEHCEAVAAEKGIKPGDRVLVAASLGNPETVGIFEKFYYRHDSLTAIVYKIKNDGTPIK